MLHGIVASPEALGGSNPAWGRGNLSATVWESQNSSCAPRVIEEGLGSQTKSEPGNLSGYSA